MRASISGHIAIEAGPTMNVRLIHYKAAKGNVGDDFSAWMVSRLLSTPLDEKASSVLFGVGSFQVSPP